MRMLSGNPQIYQRSCSNAPRRKWISSCSAMPIESSQFYGQFNHTRRHALHSPGCLIQVPVPSFRSLHHMPGLTRPWSAGDPGTGWHCRSPLPSDLPWFQGNPTNHHLAAITSDGRFPEPHLPVLWRSPARHNNWQTFSWIRSKTKIELWGCFPRSGILIVRRSSAALPAKPCPIITGNG